MQQPPSSGQPPPYAQQEPFGQQPYGQPPYGGPPQQDLQPQEDSDKILAALTYIFCPWVSILILVTEMKNKPFLKYHAYQGLTLALVAFVLSITVVGLCLLPFVLIAQFWFAYQAYATGIFVIPTLTDWTAKLFKDFPQQPSNF